MQEVSLLKESLQNMSNDAGKSSEHLSSLSSQVQELKGHIKRTERELFAKKREVEAAAFQVTDPVLLRNSSSPYSTCLTFVNFLL